MNKLTDQNLRVVWIVLVAALSFVLATSSVLWGIYQVVHYYGKNINSDFCAESLIEIGENIRRGRKWGPKRKHVVIAGDSMLMASRHATDPSRQSVPGVLQQLLDSSNIEIHPMAMLGQGYNRYYYLAERYIATSADLIAFEWNPLVFSSNWRLNNASKEQLRCLETHRFAEAIFLPLDQLGVTLDTLVLANLENRLGLMNFGTRVERFQKGVQQLYISSVPEVENQLGLEALKDFVVSRYAHLRQRMMLPTTPERWNVQFASRNYKDVFQGMSEEDISFQMLKATLRRMRSAGITVLVFVVPINYQHLEKLGIYDRIAFQHSIEILKKISEESGAHFISLLEFLPDNKFLDGVGHLTFKGGDSGIWRLSWRLFPVIQQLLYPSPTERR